MQRWITAAIAAAALAATTGLAQADEHHRNDSRGAHNDWRGHGDRHNSRDSRNWQQPRYEARVRGADSWRGRESWHPEPQGGGRGWRPSAYRPSGYHPWARGGYLPRAYFGPRYVVRDYGYYGLRAPPYGYGWVRVNNDFLLAALATGFVADVFFGGY